MVNTKANEAFGALYMPKLLGENDWLDNLRQEFQANLNKFKATITKESQQS